MTHHPVISWLWISASTFPLSIILGFCFTIGQDGPGAAMGFGGGFLAGIILLGLPSSFRLVRLLRLHAATTKKIHLVIGRTIVTLNLLVIAPFLTLLLAEGYIVAVFICIVAIYWGLFRFEKPQLF